MTKRPAVDLSSDVWVERWEVLGSSGNKYIVARHRNGTFGCACQGWTTQKKEKWVYDPTTHLMMRADCRHILQKKLELLQKGLMPIVKQFKPKEPTFDNDRDIILDE